MSIYIDGLDIFTAISDYLTTPLVVYPSIFAGVICRKKYQIALSILAISIISISYNYLILINRGFSGVMNRDVVFAVLLSVLCSGIIIGVCVMFRKIITILSSVRDRGS